MSVYTPATDTRDSIDVDTPLPFPTIYIAIPVVNLLCIPLLYNSKYSTWHASICQCIILTVLVLCTYFFGSIYSLCMIFLVCIAIAYIPRGSTYRLPICYQIYTLVRYIVGLFRRTRADISTLQTSTQTAGYTFDTEKK
jgi:membrane-associated HD superfamily phosphohydrolase